MNTMNKTALVLGATGGIGGSIAAALMRHGWTVRALARDTGAAEQNWTNGAAPAWISGDAMNRSDVVAAAHGVSAIIHAVNPPGYRNWDRLVLPMMENTIAAARAAGGVRVVLPGTIYNFDPAQTPVIDAETPQRPRTRKGTIRVQLERLLEEAAPDVPSLILRAGDFFGPGARASWFSQAMIKPGTPICALTVLTRTRGHSWAYLPDLAETFAQLMDTTETLAPFERVQFEGYCDTTGTGINDAVCRAVGRQIPVRNFPWWAMRLLAPFGGFPREAAEIEQYWRHPMRFDNHRLLSLIGAEPRTPLATAMARTLADLDCLDAP